MMTTTRFFLVTMLLSTVPAIASAQLDIAIEPQFAQPPGQPVEIAPQQAPLIAEPPMEEESEVAIGLGVWAQMISFDELDLVFGTTEIEALRNVDLREWQGHQLLDAPVLGGASLDVGARWDGWIRAPEVRFMLGGTDFEENWMVAPGDSGLELSLESAWVFRTQLGFGFQAPLGIFRPYILGNVSIGAAWVDVGVRDERLGVIGTETAGDILLEAGVEAGVALELAEGLELGAAFTASVNHHGGESLGGMLTLRVTSED